MFHLFLGGPQSAGGKTTGQNLGAGRANSNGGAGSDRLPALRARGPRVAAAIMRALAVTLIWWPAVLLRIAARPLLRVLRLGSRSLRRGLARPVAIAIAIVRLMMVPVMPLPMLSMPGGRLILLPLSRRLKFYGRMGGIIPSPDEVVEALESLIHQPVTENVEEY